MGGLIPALALACQSLLISWEARWSVSGRSRADLIGHRSLQQTPIVRRPASRVCVCVQSHTGDLTGSDSFSDLLTCLFVLFFPTCFLINLQPQTDTFISVNSLYTFPRLIE